MTPALLLLLAAATPQTAPIWYRITVGDGTPIGHAAHSIVDRADGRDIIDEQEISLIEREHGAIHLIDRTVVTEDKAGRTVSVVTSSEGGGGWSQSNARISAGAADIVRRTRVESRTVHVALPPDVRFDDGDGLLPGWNPAVTPRLEFDALNVAAMAVEHVVIEPLPGDVRGGVIALRRHYAGGALRSVAQLVLDRDHRIVGVKQPLLGALIELGETDRDTALRRYKPNTVSLDLMIKAPFRIPPSALQGHIRFHFAFRGGVAFALPDTGEQRATQSPDGVTVDICAHCGPGLPGDPAALADALKPTAWLQSDHPKLKAIAGPLARSGMSDARKMALLAKKAREILHDVDFKGHYSALEALERGAGDCTEDAVLLAALGRAAGVPTKVVNGLVYVRGQYHGVSNAFLPHSWTLAWIDGAWRSLDMTLGTFDTSHIALTIGDGDVRSVLAASELASLLQIETMAEVKPRITAGPALP